MYFSLVPFIVYVLMFFFFFMCMINKMQYLYIWGLAIDRLHSLCRFLHILIYVLFLCVCVLAFA